MFECVTDGSQDLFFLLLTLPDDSYAAAKDGQQVSGSWPCGHMHLPLLHTATHTQALIQLHIPFSYAVA